MMEPGERIHHGVFDHVRYSDGHEGFVSGAALEDQPGGERPLGRLPEHRETVDLAHGHEQAR